MIDDLPRAKLFDLVRRLGVGLAADPRHFETLLIEACGGGWAAECAALVAAIRCGVFDALRRPSSAPRAALLDRLTDRLAADAGLSQFLARWSVECWAVALGAVAPSDRLLILKLDALARLIEEEAARGGVGLADLDRFATEAVRRGIAEADARTYLAKRLASGTAPPLALQVEEPSSATAASADPPHPAPPVSRDAAATAEAPVVEQAGSTAAAGRAAEDAARLRVVLLRQHVRAAPAIRRWRAARLAVAAGVAAIALVAVIAIRQYPALQPSVPPALEQQKVRAATELARQRAAAQRQREEAEERRRIQAVLAAQEAEQAKLAAKQRQRAETAAREQQAYNAASGNLAALDDYVNTCVVCTYSAEARAEIRNLQAADEDRRLYNEARGNLAALQTYLKTCDVCAFKSAASAEIATLSQPKPDIEGIVSLAPKADWLMVGKRWVHLFGIVDAPLYNRSHESSIRGYLEPSNGVVQCFLRSSGRYQCFAAGKDIALLALEDGIATPEPGAPSAYLALARP